MKNCFVDASELGLTVGSSAATKLASHCMNYFLRQPQAVKIKCESGVEPWFASIAHIDSRTRISFDNFTVGFEKSLIDLTLNDVMLKSTSIINLLPLPFFIGEDTAHVTAHINRARLKLSVHDFDVKLVGCELESGGVDVSLDRAFLLNSIFSLFQRVLPQTIMQDSLCTWMEDSLMRLHNRFHLERQLASLIPSQWQKYLISPNTTIFLQVGPLEARDHALIVRTAIEWMNTTTAGPSMQPMNNTEVLLDSAQGEIVSEHDERLTIWFEDKLINQVLDQFRWDFEWLRKDIPVESQEIPAQTREFLSALCNNCYFELNVSANGAPRVQSVNESIVLEKSDRIFLKVVNPSRNVTSVFVSFYLFLNVQLLPKIENGIFRTRVELLDTQIKMEKGAFPSSWNFFVQDLTRGMITDVIWPGLKKEIELLAYSDGLAISDHCGFEPSTAQVHLEDGRFGASVELLLSQVSTRTCIQQLQSKVPDLGKLAMIKDGTI
uniref:Uncharacterized protein n=1 Tax=Acrobeloides nanus TaxID=290746 RepID=A0A914EDH1_9BILA